MQTPPPERRFEDRPTCPECGEHSSRIIKDQAVREGVEHEGQQRKATRQLRACRFCNYQWVALKLGSEIRKKRRTSTGPWAEREQPTPTRKAYTL